ncbi:MAG: anti-sigma factor family protein [Candidatus Rokuibacteriota bacterium]
MEHPTTDLIAYLQGELGAAEREQLEAHLAACAGCRRERDAFAAILGGLRASAPTTSDPHWGRWRSELGARLEARGHRRWWLRPVPMALSAGLAGAVLALAWLGGERLAPHPDVASLEEVVGDGLEPEPLEDLDVIQQLDRLAARGEG